MSEEKNWSPVEDDPQAQDDEVFSFSSNAITYAAIALMFFVVGVAVGGLVFGQSDNLDEATLRIVLNEALADIDFGANTQTVDYMADDDPFLGPEDAPVVVVEFSDFLCGFCGRHFEQTLEPLLEEYDGYIRYVYRDFPGVGGQSAVQSALAAECAHDQDMFWEYHNLLFSDQQALSSPGLNDLLVSYAEELELDMETFTTCLEDQVHSNDIILDRNDGQSVGARGTPAFLINGRFLSGAQPYETFAAIIEDTLSDMGIEREDA